MPMFEVPLTVWLDADNIQEALDKAMDLLPQERGARTYNLASGGDAVELSPEDTSNLREFLEMLEQGVADAEAGNLITSDRTPGLRFTPAAAAALMALELEGNAEPGL